MTGKEIDYRPRFGSVLLLLCVTRQRSEIQSPELHLRGNHMATTTSPKRRISHPYVMRKKGTCGGKPIIRGTRIRVSQIAIEYEQLGMTPDEIVRAHPHLTLAQVHDALSFYYENIKEINEDIRTDKEYVAQLRRKHPSILNQKSGRT